MAFSQVQCTEPELWSDPFPVEGHGIPKLFWERWHNCAKYSGKNILLIVDDKWWGMSLFFFFNVKYFVALQWVLSREICVPGKDKNLN